jgi:hypothetical protein
MEILPFSIPQQKEYQMGGSLRVEKNDFQRNMLQHPKLAALSVSIQLISG